MYFDIGSNIGNWSLANIKSCDKIISVSKYTAEKIKNVHQINPQKITVLNNCLDPFLPLGKEFIGNNSLRKLYGFTEKDKILFTLTRLSSKERYKGYDRVIQSLVKVKENYPEIKYVIAGSYDEIEKKYIDDLIRKLNLQDNLKIVGFVPDDSLVAHFSMADIYVMPSMKEGFGYAVGLDGDYQNLTYFTEEEMFKHFILSYDLIKIKLRDKKINQLLETDKYN